MDNPECNNSAKIMLPKYAYRKIEEQVESHKLSNLQIFYGKDIS